MGRTGGCAAGNELCTGPIPTLVMAVILAGGLLAATHVAKSVGQQHEVRGPKKNVMRRTCANLSITKASIPQVHTNTHTHQMLYKKEKKGKRCHLLKLFLHPELSNLFPGYSSF